MATTDFMSRDGKAGWRYSLAESGCEYWHIKKNGEWLLTLKAPTTEQLENTYPF